VYIQPYHTLLYTQTILIVCSIICSLATGYGVLELILSSSFIPGIKFQIMQLSVPLFKEVIVRFEAFTAVKIQVEVFWVVTPCNVMSGFQCCRGSCYLHPENGDSTDF